MFDTERKESASARTEVLVWTIERVAFQRCLMLYNSKCAGVVGARRSARLTG